MKVQLFLDGRPHQRILIFNFVFNVNSQSATWNTAIGGGGRRHKLEPQKHNCDWSSTPRFTWACPNWGAIIHRPALSFCSPRASALCFLFNDPAWHAQCLFGLFQLPACQRPTNRPCYINCNGPLCELCLLLFKLGNNIWKNRVQPKSEIAGITAFLVSMVSMYSLSYS